MNLKSKLNNRVVAFIDVLGFRKLMDTIDDGDIEIEKAIFESLSHTKSISTKISAKNNADFQMTAFSDSIVISAKPRNFFPLLMAVHSHYNSLLEIGLLCRGAVTLGPVYHKNGVVFGKGLVNAYSLETKVAIHPRIIVPDEFYKKLLQFNKRIGPNGNILSDILLQDSDGIWFIDPFIFPHDPFIRKDFIEKLPLFRKVISNGLKDPSNLKNISILSKYRWIAFRFNSLISKKNIRIRPIKI